MHAHTLAGPVLPLCFLAGVALYIVRDRIPVSPVLCVIAFGSCMLGLALPYGDFFIPLPVAYLTAAIGLLNPRKYWLVGWGDYSYGIYLYGFPVEQMVASGGPAFHHWYMILGFAVPLTIVFAAFSWKLVEQPVLSLRHHVRKLDVISIFLYQRQRELSAAIRSALRISIGAGPPAR
jgi:peptidoglycan/LPS O-acetylase OafA/YrhL